VDIAASDDSPEAAPLIAVVGSCVISDQLLPFHSKASPGYPLKTIPASVDEPAPRRKS